MEGDSVVVTAKLFSNEKHNIAWNMMESLEDATGIKEGHSDAANTGHSTWKFENTFNKHAEKWCKGLALLNPLISLTSSGKTLVTGSDIYGNKADGVDYTLSTIDLVTFGFSSYLYIFKGGKMVKGGCDIAKGVDNVGKCGTGSTILKTEYTEYTK